MRARLSCLAVLILFSLSVAVTLPSPALAAETTAVKGARLMLNAAPSMLVADGNGYRCIYIQLLDASGTPALFTEATTVFLSSSNTLVGTVPESLSIEEGESLAVIEFQTTLTPGKTTIHAIAHGLSSEPATIETVSPYGAIGQPKLVIAASPSKMYKNSPQPGLVTVEILGENDVPRPVGTDTVVRLTSSNPAVASVVTELVIERGRYLVTGEWTPLGTGQATLTALASDFAFASANIEVTEPGGKPEKLALYLPYPRIASQGNVEGSVLAQALDSKGIPVPFPPDTMLNLSSSDLSVAQVEGSVSGKPEGAAYVRAKVSMGGKVGATSISASAPGLQAQSASLVVSGLVPKKSKVYSALPVTLARSGPSNYLVITLLSERELPASLHPEIKMLLSSPDPSVPASATIPANSSFVAVPISGPVAKEISVSAIASGLEASALTMSFIKLGLNVSLSARPETVLAGEASEIRVRVTYSGVPLAGAAIAWSASDSLIQGANVSDDRGSATALLTATGSGVVTVEARVSSTSPALGEGSASVQVKVIPSSATGGGTLKIGPIPILWLVVAMVLIILGIGGYLGVQYFREKKGS